MTPKRDNPFDRSNWLEWWARWPPKPPLTPSGRDFLLLLWRSVVIGVLCSVIAYSIALSRRDCEAKKCERGVARQTLGAGCVCVEIPK